MDVLFSNIFYTKQNDTNKIVRKWTSNLKDGIQSNNILNKKINNGWMPPHPTIFFKRDLLDKIGYYNEDLIISSDYDFIIRMFRENNLKIFFLNKVTLKMRIGGISNKNLKNFFENERRFNYHEKI